jgi:SAM-dependent MidA family methyltransferase
MVEKQRIGKGGDFFTSSSVHAVFGRLIARQLAQMWDVLGCGTFTVAEQGGGEGYLALDILDALAEEAPECYQQLSYRLVEISPDHRRRQAERLKRHSEHVSWCHLEDLDGMQGCLISNELVDAFPVRMVERSAEGWGEVFIVEDDGALVEQLLPADEDDLDEYFRSIEVCPTIGNRYEIRTAARDWMERIGKILRRGFVLTIDYGYLADELYAPWRRSGTLMCYYRHQVNEEPLRRIGRQDLTTHVDFSLLQKVGTANGLLSLFYGEQYRFLLALGFVDALLALESQTHDEKEALALRMTLKMLIMPEGGMGETFKVLIQGKDIGRPELLCGRKLSRLPL